jgi:hypothetical protein
MYPADYAQAFSSLCLAWRSLFMRPLKAVYLIFSEERQQEMSAP